MKRLAIIAAATIMAASACFAQKAVSGNIKHSELVVTNEQDLVALQALADEATVRSNATVVLTTNLAAEASARAALGTSLSNAVAVALTNWTAALAMVAQASSNYAARAAATAAGATNAAHVAAVDPHGDRAYAGGLLATGTVARATDAARLVQIDTQAWVTVASGTATLWRVETVAGSNLSIQAQNGLNPDWGLTNGTILVKTGGDGTGAFYGAGQGNLYRVFYSTGGPPNYWYALTADQFSYWSAQNSSSPTGHYAGFGAFPGAGTVDLAWVPSTLQITVTNAYPLARIADLPALDQYCTAAQLAAVSNAMMQSVNVAMTNWGSALGATAAAGSNYAVTAAQQVVAPYTNGATLGGSAVQPAALSDYLPKAGGSLDVAAELRLDKLAWPAAASGTRRWWNRYNDEDNSLYWRLCDPDDGTTELGRWVLPWVWGTKTFASTAQVAEKPGYSDVTNAVNTLAATSGQLSALSNAVLGAWNAAVVSNGVLSLDWSAGMYRSASPTNASYSVTLTNQPAGPRALTMLLTTPATTVPTITWPTNLLWSSQLDVTSNRVYFISIIWDGGSYAAVPVYSR